MIERSCLICSDVFRLYPSKEKTAKYCSKSCHAQGTIVGLPRTEIWKSRIAKSLTGIKRSEETKEKVRISHIGVRQTPEQIAKRVAKNTGKRRTEEVKQKMSISAKKAGTGLWTKGRKGELCPAWKGGITPLNRLIRASVEYRDWRKAVFERDDYTCQMCEIRGGRLEAHHIESFALFPEKRFEVENGQTLCAPCHRKTPNWGSKK